MHIRAVINTSPGRTDRLKSLPILLVRFTFVNARGFGARLFRTRVTRDDKLFFPSCRIIPRITRPGIRIRHNNGEGVAPERAVKQKYDSSSAVEATLGQRGSARVSPTNASSSPLKFAQLRHGFVGR